MDDTTRIAELEARLEAAERELEFLRSICGVIGPGLETAADLLRKLRPQPE